MTDTFNQLRELRLIAEAELIEVQKQVHPDSRILSLQNVYREWLSEVPPGLEHDMAHWDKTLGRAYSSEDDLRRNVDRSMQYSYLLSLYKADVSRSVSTALQFPAFVFYECGKKEDGTYRWRGCRYGLQDHEYIGGFGRV